MQLFDENFWLAVCFVLFVILMYYYCKGAILSLLDNKINDIKEKIKEAATLRAQAEDLLKNTLIEIDKLKSLREEVIQNTITQTKEVIAFQSAEMDHQIDNRKLQMAKFIENKKTEAINQISIDFISQATDLVEEYLKDTNNENLNDIEIAEILKIKYI